MELSKVLVKDKKNTARATNSATLLVEAPPGGRLTAHAQATFYHLHQTQAQGSTLHVHQEC